MDFNYFALLCFVWAGIGLCSRMLILKLGARWKDWEENRAYTDKRPIWLLPVDVFVLAVILFTWYRVWVSDVKGAWIIATLMTLILVKAILQLFQYDQFKAFVKKAMQDEKLFSRINTGVMIFSVCLIGLGVFYML